MYADLWTARLQADVIMKEKWHQQCNMHTIASAQVNYDWHNLIEQRRYSRGTLLQRAARSRAKARCRAMATAAFALHQTINFLPNLIKSLYLLNP